MTTDSSSSSSNNDNTPNEEVSVYCRIRPLTNDNDESCIRVIDDKTVQLTPPESSRAFFSWGFNEKEVQYTFKKVFDVTSTQKQVFDQVCVTPWTSLLQY
jgi:kinesin family protein 23